MTAVFRTGQLMTMSQSHFKITFIIPVNIYHNKVQSVSFRLKLRLSVSPHTFIYSFINFFFLKLFSCLHSFRDSDLKSKHNQGWWAWVTMCEYIQTNPTGILFFFLHYTQMYPSSCFRLRLAPITCINCLLIIHLNNPLSTLMDFSCMVSLCHIEIQKCIKFYFLNTEL